MRPNLQLMLLATFVAGVVVVGGCSKAPNANPSQKEVQAFKGGPPPANIQQKIAESSRTIPKSAVPPTGAQGTKQQ